MKIALIIPTFNRPKYLKQCLDSVKNTYLKEGSLIYIIDDGSTDEETLKLINEFEKPGCITEKIFKQTNVGSYDSMLTAYEYCYSKYEYVILIGSDIIVNNYFYDMMTYYYTLFPNNIISGFNTLTISEIGLPRHPVVEDCGFYVKKNTSGSACFGFNKKIYDKFFKKTLEDLHKKNSKCYDTISTKNASNEGSHVICTVPSVVEHIGIESSMGHNVQPDVSVDYMQHIDLLSKKEKLITFNLATYPARIESFKKVIDNLLSIDLINKIRVYLNEYNYVPDFLKNEKIEYVVGEENLKDSGKFYWAQDYKDEYYFSIDDDLLIDEKYINEHIKLLNKYGNNVMVSLHGKVLNEIPKNFRDNKEYYHCLENVDKDKIINFPGTGVMVFDNSKIKFPINMFKYHGMADLWIARYCQLNNIPCIVRQHKKGDITLCYQGNDTLWNSHNSFTDQHNEILRSIPKWKTFEINNYDSPIINDIIEDFNQIHPLNIEIVKPTQENQYPTIEIVKPELTKKQINYDKINSIFQNNNPKVILQQQPKQETGNLKLNSETFSKIQRPKKRLR